MLKPREPRLVALRGRRSPRQWLNYRRGLLVRKRTNSQRLRQVATFQACHGRPAREFMGETPMPRLSVRLARAVTPRHQCRTPLTEPGAQGFGGQLIAQVVPLTTRGSAGGLLRPAEVGQQVDQRHGLLLRGTSRV